MKKGLLFSGFLSLALSSGYAQQTDANKKWLVQRAQLTLNTALELAKRVRDKAHTMGKEVSVAIVGSQGETLVLMKGDGVGVHNTEAARRKAFTALSTKTSTLSLLRAIRQNPDSYNLNTLPELLLLSGGVPIWQGAYVIGAVGVAGGGGADNDEIIAKAATIAEAEIIAK